MQTVNSVCLISVTMMVSFNVSPQFTYAPIDEAVSVIRNKLNNDENLHDRACLFLNEYIRIIRGLS